MKIEQGFVAATADGQFLTWWQVSTHLGYRTEFGTVTDIDMAGFSRMATDRRWPHDAQNKAPPHTWVPVERRTEVILKGYGT